MRISNRTSVRIVALVKFAILPADRGGWKTAPVRIVALVKFAILPADLAMQHESPSHRLSTMLYRLSPDSEVPLVW